jgi:para-nitrobenzyl esterase
MAQAGLPVWMYLFTYRSTSTEARHGSAHAMELPFLFGNLDAPLVAGFTGEGPGRDRLSATVQAGWSSFARHGEPTVPGMPAWPRYDAVLRSTLDLNIDCQLRVDPMGGQRSVWDGLPFDGISPDERAITRLTFSDT